MANNIKGITVEFSADTKKLDKALNGIKRETKSIDTQLRDVNNALKFNPGNTQLLAQKTQLLDLRGRIVLPQSAAERRIGAVVQSG